jgi:hypothetical protein
MQRAQLSEKYYQYLLHLLDTDETKEVHTLLSHSRVEIEDDWRSNGAVNLFFIVDPEIYKRSQKHLSWIARTIESKFFQFTNVYVSNTEIKPDLDKFQILNNRIVPIFTPWEEINSNQNKLLESLRRSSEPLDYQEVGLISRTIMQKLANEVFDNAKHKHNNPQAELSDGKFKNQLVAFIQTTLKGDDNKKFRKLAEASIDMLENSSDFMNSTTHKLNAEKHLAELCAISTVSAVSIVKFVKELE